MNRPKAHQIGIHLVAIICVMAALNFCMAHDVDLHGKIAETAFPLSKGLNSFLIETLGTGDSPFATAPQLSVASGPGLSKSLSPQQWMAWGCYTEDGAPFDSPLSDYGFTYMDHFYTINFNTSPRSVSPLTDFTEGIAPPQSVKNRIVNSFKWATTQGGVNPLTQEPYLYTWPDARAYEFASLTRANRSDRQDSLGTMLLALGHILHLNQDLSSPDHVRNDEHLPSPHKAFEPFGNKEFRNHQEWFQLPPGATVGWSNWLREGFSSISTFWDRGLYTGSVQALRDALNADANGGAKLGLAEFSNGNFLGEDSTYTEDVIAHFDTQLHYFPFPRRSGMQVFLEPKSYGNSTSYQKAYLRKTGDGIPISHHSTMDYITAMQYYTEGIVRLDSTTIGPLIKDDKVLNDYHTILIPKAIEYSAGILDYFFRGRLEISTFLNQESGQHTIHIVNKSGQPLQGGSFHLFYDDGNDVRTEISGSGFSYSPISSVPNDGSIDATFTPQATAKCYTIVYQGSIGSEDIKDAAISVAAKSFTLCDVPKRAAPTKLSKLTTMEGPQGDGDGVYLQTTAGFSMPPIGGTVTVPFDVQPGIDESYLVGIDNWIIGYTLTLAGVGDFEVIDCESTSSAQTLTLKNKGIVSNLPYNTPVASHTFVDSLPTVLRQQTVYVPSVNKIFVNTGRDIIEVYNPDSLTFESYFHISNELTRHNDQNYNGLVYACDCDRLYAMQDTGIYVIDPHTCQAQSIGWFPDNSEDVGLTAVIGDNGFFDPDHHRVGFGYFAYHQYGGGLDYNGFVAIKTTDNSIEEDLNVLNVTWEHCIAANSTADNRIYIYKGDATIVLTNSDLSYVTQINGYNYGGFAPDQLIATPNTGELYGNGFKIAVADFRSETTTLEVLAPAIGHTVQFHVTSTSGIPFGGRVNISGVDWQVVSMDSPNQFTAKNLSVTPSTPIPNGANVSWIGPNVHSFAMPNDDIYSVSYSSVFQEVMFCGIQEIAVYDPLTKIWHEIPTPDGYANLGCDGPNGKYFFTWWPYPDSPSAVSVFH